MKSFQHCSQPPQRLNAAEQMKNNSCYRILMLKPAWSLQVPYNHYLSSLLMKHWSFHKNTTSNIACKNLHGIVPKVTGCRQRVNGLAGVGKLSHIRINFYYFILPHYLWHICRYSDILWLTSTNLKSPFLLFLLQEDCPLASQDLLVPPWSLSGVLTEKKRGGTKHYESF